MEKKLCIFVCNNFAQEVRQVLDEKNNRDVEVMEIHMNCTGPLLDASDLASQMQRCKKRFHKVVCFGSSCIQGKHAKQIEALDLEYISHNQCFDLILPPKLVEHFIQEQNYLVSAGWFNNFEANLANWGFEPTMASEFFGETANNILYIETDSQFTNRDLLEELSSYMGLPYSILNVGSDYLREKINSIVNQWKIECDREISRIQLSKANRASADYSMIFHQINSLLGLTDKKDLLEKVFYFFESLYAPKEIVFIPLGAEDKAWVWFKGDNAVDVSNNSKYLPMNIDFNAEIIGEFRIYDVRFPEHNERYKDSIETIRGMIGLAFSNVEKFEVISDNQLILSRQTEELQEHIQIRNRFFSIIAHDLRGPFNSILGLSRVLIEDYDEMKDSYRLAMLKKIGQSSDSYFQLLENLLEWAGTQTGRIVYNPKNIDFSEIVEDCVDLFGNSYETKGVRLKNNIASGTTIFADRNMITTVVRNLISNSLKFTNAGGRVEIKSLKSTSENPDKLLFCISDTGIGMTKDQQSNLFKEDRKVHSKGTENEPGSGLGLLLVSEMLTAHNCEIMVMSEVDNGSCFKFSLPKGRLISY